MSRWRQSILPKFSKKQRVSSITKDETVSLGSHLEYFSPKFIQNLSLLEGSLYILAWAIFVTGFKLASITSWREFVTLFIIEALIMSSTLAPSIFLIELQRERLKEVSLIQVTLRIMATTVSMGIVASLLVLFFADFFNFVQLEAKEVVIQTVSHTLDVMTLTAIILMYSIRRFKELRILKALFDKKLDTQNDHIKARLAPHFFFNTINTLASLVETDGEKASDLLHHVTHLFRSSFSDPKETSFEEEIELCHHYLAIEHYRLRDKLVVTWDLPDEELIYDMSITSLTLQNVLEQTVLHLVEMTTDTVNIDIQAVWQNHSVVIKVSAQMPKNMLVITHNIESRINFSIQEKRLREHFGPTAEITTHINENMVVNTITYPLHDALG